MFKLNLVKRKQREIKRYSRSLLSEIRDEIIRIEDEIEECTRTLRSYEKFVAESVLYITDRNNLNTSKITGIHNARIKHIETQILLLDKLELVSFGDIVKSIETQNEATQTKIKEISAALTRGTNVFNDVMPEFMQNINRKILVMQNQKSLLTRLYKVIEQERDHMLVLNEKKPETIKEAQTK